LFAGSQAIISEDEGSMRMALYLLGWRVGNYNLWIEIDKSERLIFKWKGINPDKGQNESK
jgi:hypothetical protein